MGRGDGGGGTKGKAGEGKLRRGGKKETAGGYII